MTENLKYLFGFCLVLLEGSGRFRLPNDFADSFPGNAYIIEWPGPCVKIYPEKTWTPYIEALTKDGSRVDQRTAWEHRYVFGSAEKVEVKAKGRITIPQRLRDYAGLKEGKKILVLGVNDHIELWASEELYNAARMTSGFMG